MSEEAQSDESFEQKLLTGDSKWWEFLDPETYEVKDELPTARRSTSDRLDWSRTHRERRPGPVGFAFFNHCDRCGQGVPPDFTFCVHCGGSPRSIDPPNVHSIVIADFDSADAKEGAAELLTTSGEELEFDEVLAMLDAPPAVFNVTGRRDQVAALVAKLAEVGIRARAFRVDDPSVPWFRETLESLARTPQKLAMVALIAGVTIAMTLFWTAWLIPLGLAAFALLFFRELKWYRERYHVDVRSLLELVTGFDRETAEIARDTLRKLRDDDARAQVTICLMEYYTLTQQIRAHGAVYGDVLAAARGSLEELMADVLVLAHKYAQLDDFLKSNPTAVVKDRIRELRERETGTPNDEMAARELEALEQQMEDRERMEQSREAFRERLETLANSMEHLRRRIAAVRAKPSEQAWREMEIDRSLAELDAEFEVFEQTFEVVG